MFTSCANQGQLMGGPKDSVPPVLLRTYPPMYSTNVKKKSYTLKFNEFVEIKDPINVVVSPPLEQKPDFFQKGKGFKIKFKEDSLKENITYTVSFGDRVVDLNEGNILENFEYVFSTGDRVDSLAIGGKLLNAFNHNPIENTYVVLYNTNEDSIPLKERPLYISKTDKEGIFRIRNIAPASYKIFALEDFNRNLLFDLPTEKIAFSDSLITPYSEIETFIDTVWSETNYFDYELVEEDYLVLKPHNLRLYLFEEEAQKQYLEDFNRNEKHKIILLFNKGVKNIPELKPVNFTTKGEWYKVEENEKRDSLIYWITDDTTRNLDSINVELTYFKTDTLNVDRKFTDTILFKKPKLKASNYPEFLTIKSNIEGTFDLNQNITLALDEFTEIADASSIKLFSSKDSSCVKISQSRNLYNNRDLKLISDIKNEDKGPSLSGFGLGKRKKKKKKKNNVASIDENKRVIPGKILLEFSNPLKNLPVISINGNTDNIYAEAIDESMKKIEVWLKNRADRETEKIKLAVAYEYFDTQEDKYEFKSDTMEIKTEKDRSVDELFNILKIEDKDKKELDNTVVVEFSHPISSIDNSAIGIYEMTEFKDTIQTPNDSINKEKIVTKYDSLKLDIKFEKTNSLRKFNLNYNWSDNKKYRLHISKGALTDIFDEKNDTISYEMVAVNKENIPSYISEKFEFKKDSVKPRTFNIIYNFSDDESYRIIIDSATFRNSFGKINKKIDQDFKTQKISEYGKLIFNITDTKTSYDKIIQLVSFNDKEEIIQEYTFNGSTTLNFEYLKPGDYLIKIHHDINGDKKWNTGKYIDKKHPEKIQYFSKIITIIKNWDTDLSWDLTTDEIPYKPTQKDKKEKEDKDKKDDHSDHNHSGSSRSSRPSIQR